MMTLMHHIGAPCPATEGKSHFGCASLEECTRMTQSPGESVIPGYGKGACIPPGREADAPLLRHKVGRK